LLLERHGFSLCRYVSLERLVEESKDEYYSVLERCSRGWHEGTNELVPWLNYLLGVIRRGYDELARQVESAEDTGKSELIRQAVMRQPVTFTLGDIQAACPSASVQLVKKVLSQLKEDGKVSLTGKGRGAHWRVVE
jgi:Fic family protein